MLTFISFLLRVCYKKMIVFPATIDRLYHDARVIWLLRLYVFVKTMIIRK